MKLNEMVSKNYYHATYKPYLDSILKKGLTKSIAKKSWKGSGNYVYLSINPDVAESYAETTDDVPEEFLDNIVVLKIDGDKLKRNLLQTDEKNKSGDTIQYNDDIPPSAIKVFRG